MQTITTASPDGTLHNEAVQILEKELGDERNRRRYLAQAPRGLTWTEAEDALNDTIVKLLVEFRKYDDAKLKKFISRPSTFITVAFVSKSRDAFRKAERKYSKPQSDFLPYGEDQSHDREDTFSHGEVIYTNVWEDGNEFDDPAKVFDRSEDLKARQALEDCILGIINCLAERAQVGKTRPTSLNDKELEAAALAYRLEFKQREIAEMLGETEGTTSKRIKHIKNTVRLTIYLAGVLGRDGALPTSGTSYEACDHHLDAYEGLLDKQDRTRLIDASPSLATQPSVGTRIIAERYLTKYKEDTDLQLDLLHASEATYASAVGNPEPRCVTACEAHNPSGSDRPLEIAQ